MGNYWSDGDLPAIPDFTDPVRLYRTFRGKVANSFYTMFNDAPAMEYVRGFYSTSHDYSWGSGDVEAACLGWTGGGPAKHPAPSRECACGFYGYHLPVQSTEFAEINDFVAVIEGWGHVIVHSLGARVQYARIVAVAPTPRATDDDRQWLIGNHGSHRIDVLNDPQAMYEKYPPQDTTPFLGVTAIEAESTFRQKQKEKEEKRQREMLIEGHKNALAGQMMKVCRCTGCKQFFDQNCGDPFCGICNGTYYLGDDGMTHPSFALRDIKIPNPADFPLGSWMNAMNQPENQ